MFHVKQNFVLAPEIYHCCGIVMSPCPSSLFIFLLMFVFLFLWHFPRHFFRWILMTLTVKFLPMNLFGYHLPPPLILFLLYLTRCPHGLSVSKNWKAQTKTQFFFKGHFSKIFQNFSTRNTNLTRNIVMVAPVTMNSTLDNAEVLDPPWNLYLKTE